jgi:hypothetical protein
LATSRRRSRDSIDASNLLLPTLGIIDPSDPRFVSTVRAYERLLVENGLMLRYKHPDDFGATTSACTICSFWWVESLAMMGEVDPAVSVFNRLLGHANPLGLFSEDIEPQTGRLLGNFPQAYTHVGLIHAAITIGEILEARTAHFRAWTQDQDSLAFSRSSDSAPSAPRPRRVPASSRSPGRYAQDGAGNATRTSAATNPR